MSRCIVLPAISDCSCSSRTSRWDEIRLDEMRWDEMSHKMRDKTWEDISLKLINCTTFFATSSHSSYSYHHWPHPMPCLCPTRYELNTCYFISTNFLSLILFYCILFIYHFLPCGVIVIDHMFYFFAPVPPPPLSSVLLHSNSILFSNHLTHTHTHTSFS